MNKYVLLFTILCLLTACNQHKNNSQSETIESADAITPMAFLPNLTPEGMIIHGGSFSPDMKQYYFTLSDTLYSRFDVKMIEQIDGKWSEAKSAFFNSEFSEHGAKYAPDGQHIYFSSTRPTDIQGVPDTLHLWMTLKDDDGWSKPNFIDIPNLRDKLVSHPSITTDGTLYFHASNLDYSEMTLYSSQWKNGQFGKAEKLAITENSLACTPFVTASGQTLLYAAIGETLELMMSHKTENGTWSAPKPLNTNINTNGQGNPFLTPNGQFLYYTSSPEATKWQVNKVSTKGW